MKLCSVRAVLVCGLWPALWGAGCSDYRIEEDKDYNPTEPDIAAEPGQVDFGGVAHDDDGTQILQIYNVGNGVLRVDGLLISTEGIFSLVDAFEPVELEAGDSIDLELLYEPSGASNDAVLTIYSNDPQEPELAVPLAGQGLYPLLEADPKSLDLGGVGRCHTETESVTFTNVGDADLEISAMTAVGMGWSVEHAFSLPLTLAPGAYDTVSVTFAPESEGEVEGGLWIDSNEPGEQREVPLVADGSGFATDERTDSFRQTEGPYDKAAFLFFVDQSSSMDDDRQRLSDNFGALVEVLDDSGIEWKAMVATDDDGCANGGIIEGGSAGAADAFSDAVVGPWGWFAEAGLSVARAALRNTQAGDCNVGFIEEGAKPILVMVSDEAEQSEDGWLSVTTDISTLAEGVSIVGIVGDLPDGCSSADAGNGYHEAAMATGGAVYSICDDDWADYFEDIGEFVTEGPTDTFELSDPADPDTLTVEVDGEAVTEGWTYDETLNAIVFSEMPEPGSWIEVSYEVSQDCGEADG